MKITKVLLLTLLSSASLSMGALTFSLQFSAPVGGALNNIADEASDATSGLSWGILISEDGADFDTPFSSALLTAGVSTADGSEIAPGLRYFSGGTTADLLFGTDQGTGNIGTSGTIDVSAHQPTYDTGDFFSLIWFERGFNSGDTLEIGTNYGILTNASFVVPSDGASNVPFGSNFNGADPIRAASLSVIPEPSVSLMGSLAAIGLLLRRKR